MLVVILPSNSDLQVQSLLTHVLLSKSGICWSTKGVPSLALYVTHILHSFPTTN